MQAAESAVTVIHRNSQCTHYKLGKVPLVSWLFKPSARLADKVLHKTFVQISLVSLTLSKKADKQQTCFSLVKTASANYPGKADLACFKNRDRMEINKFSSF